MFGHTVGMDQYQQNGFLGNITLLSPKSQLHIQFTGSLKLKTLKFMQNPLILEFTGSFSFQEKRVCAVFVSVVLKLLAINGKQF